MTLSQPVLDEVLELGERPRAGIGQARKHRRDIGAARPVLGEAQQLVVLLRRRAGRKETEDFGQYAHGAMLPAFGPRRCPGNIAGHDAVDDRLSEFGGGLAVLLEPRDSREIRHPLIADDGGDGVEIVTPPAAEPGIRRQELHRRGGLRDRRVSEQPARESRHVRGGHCSVVPAESVRSHYHRKVDPPGFNETGGHKANARAADEQRAER